MWEWLWLLRFKIYVGEYFLGDSIFGNEGNDFHFGATKAAEQRIYLVDFLDKLGPGEPAAAPPTVAILLLKVVTFLVWGSFEL